MHMSTSTAGAGGGGGQESRPRRLEDRQRRSGKHALDVTGCGLEGMGELEEKSFERAATRVEAQASGGHGCFELQLVAE